MICLRTNAWGPSTGPLFLFPHPPAIMLFSILLDNALKYSPEGGSITLTAKRNGKKAEVTVSNPVNAEEGRDLGRLFDRFYRADESHSAAVSGPGIGLSIARATVEAHGGEDIREADGGYHLLSGHAVKVPVFPLIRHGSAVPPSP